MGSTGKIVLLGTIALDMKDNWLLAWGTTVGATEAWL